MRDLAPLLAELLCEEGWKTRDLDGVIVSRGPGSYTGLRVGIMSAKTLAYATGCGLFAVDTFAAIALQTPAPVSQVDVIADAQQDKIYVQAFARQADGETWLATNELAIIAFEEWDKLRDKSVLIAGPGLEIFRPALANYPANRCGTLVAQARKLAAAGAGALTSGKTRRSICRGAALFAAQFGGGKAWPRRRNRVDLRKNRSKPPRTAPVDARLSGARLHRRSDRSTTSASAPRATCRASAPSSRTSRRPSGGERPTMPAVDPAVCLPGRVLRVHGLVSVVQTDDGRQFRCAVRRLLRRWPPTSATSSPPAIASGFGRRAASTTELEGFIERVEPRHGMLTRASRGREHVLVANVDQVVIVMSLVEPDLKPHLIDRYLASAEQGGIAPILCLNKADLVDPAACQPLDRLCTASSASRRC